VVYGEQQSNWICHKMVPFKNNKKYYSTITGFLDYQRWIFYTHSIIIRTDLAGTKFSSNSIRFSWTILSMCIPSVCKCICRICVFPLVFLLNSMIMTHVGQNRCSLNETSEYHNLSVLRWFALTTETLLCLKKGLPLAQRTMWCMIISPIQYCQGSSMSWS
jgi:hypothetical protein